MQRKTALWIILFSMVLVIVACTNQTSTATPNQVPTTTSSQQANGAGAASTQPSAQPASATLPSSTPAQISKPSGVIRVKEIVPDVSNDVVSVPVSVVQNAWNTHFEVASQSGKMGFMAYILDNDIYVRASVCPPCRGRTYSLDGNVLVCDMCATTFNAKTGVGIAGACVNYPKASVRYTIEDGKITMKTGDLITAYQNTLKPGLP
ncbi:MAG: Fe-S-containing protein [Dehalococcoidia bacterium]|nr:Fe-S-containing protein [Dehalococcoidia bacterium]MDD5493880.1 Fe-S-containing protein [Dehalococcoidia bacterium]